MGVPVLIPNVFQVVSVRSESFHVLESARLTNKNAELHCVVTGFILQAVDTKLVELVLQHFLVQVRYQVRMLLLGWVLWNQIYYWLLDTQIGINFSNLSRLLWLNVGWWGQILLLRILLHWNGNLTLRWLLPIDYGLGLLTKTKLISYGHVLTQ